MRKILLLTIIISLFSIMYGCDSSSNNGTAVENIVKVTGINSDDYIEINIDVINTAQINAVILPANATEKGILYASENEDIATVDSNGKITAHKTGTAYINVLSKANPSIFNRVTVFVKDNSFIPENVLSISLAEKSYQFDLNPAVNSTVYKITATVEPADLPEDKKGLEYSSNDTSVAEVSPDGTITALQTGSAVITIKSVNNPEITAKFNAEVINSQTIEKVESIELAQSSVTLDLNVESGSLTYTIQAKVLPEGINESLKLLKYTSKDSSIASVDSNGIVTAVSTGSTVITVQSESSSDITAELNVEVINTTAPVTQPAITVTPAMIKLKTNQTVGIYSKISVTLSDEYKGKYIYYKSEDDSILKVISTDKQLITNSKTGQTTLKVGIVGETDKYVDVTVIVEDGSNEPDENAPVYPDITPADAETRKDRMYIKIQFDATSSSGDLYKENDYRGLDAVQFQTTYSQCGTGNNEVCSGDLLNKGNGYINPFGYCAKYGCKVGMSSVDAEKIAKYKMGITYYAGNNKLFVPVRSSGITNDSIQVLFFIGGEGYTRPNLDFSINWNTYNPEIHKNIAKFYIKLTDKNPVISFVEFEKK